MILIDKHNLRKPSKGMFIYQDEFEDDVQHVAFEAYTKDDIEREPTVKAIPVEWIEKYAKRFIELENRNYFAYRGFSDIGEAILNMLENWEKENDSK